ncbi:MAG: hypothetical protein HDR05_03505 [Lachnospiraceae bacterium]|nr:hypothetical protein [Lachnospiraceae bacterium]
MNYTKLLFDIKQFIHRNSGKVSCGISFLLVLLFNVLGTIGFNTIMPYLVWISIWAILWQLCDSASLCPTPAFPAHIIPALLISAGICFNLYREGFLPIFFSAASLVRLITAYGIVFLSVRYLGCQLPSEKHFKILHIIGSLLFGLFSCAGNYLHFERIATPVHYPVRFLLLCFISVSSWSFLFSGALNAFHFITSRADIQKDTPTQKYIVVWGLSFITCMICYFPYLLTYYPGVIEYDSWIQLRQVFGDTYSNHHPWLHTMFIKELYNLGLTIFHSENRAVAFYSICSMSFLSSAYATSIGYLYKKGVKRYLLILLLLIYALTPINGIYSITMWKDISFASSVLLFIILLCKLHDNVLQEKNNLLHWLLFIPISFFMCFFRSNGLYTFILIIPVMLYIYWQHKKSFILSVMAVIVIAVIYKGPVFQYFGVQNVDLIESLSIPAQQMAAVISYGGEISDKDLALLEEIIDISKVPEAYLGSPTCSDAVKILVRETDNQQYISDHKGEFFAAWLRTGIKNIFYYYKAYIEETKGYWYHQVKSVFLWATYLFDGANGLGIVRECKMPNGISDIIPALLVWYHSVFDKYLSCGLYVYTLIFGFLVSLRQRREKWFTTIPLLGIWLTLLIATPVYADLRYIFAIHTALPFVMTVVMIKTENR